VLTLRLLIDLYHAQDLAEHGGLHWRHIRRQYERKRLAQHGPFVVWQFWTAESSHACWPRGSDCPLSPHICGERESEERALSSEAFWNRWNLLVGLGLVEEVPHLIEADTDDALPIHAYASAGCGEQIERDLRQAAKRAALAMLPSGLALECRGRSVMVAPVPFSAGNVQMVGIARLRYRPRNARTGAWWARLQTEGPRLVERYARITRQLGAAAA